MLTEKHMKELKSKLQEEKDELILKLQEKGKLVEEASGELSHYDNHPADSGTDLYEREKEQSFYQMYKDKLSQIDDALKRIEKGTYGHCLICDKQITLERLLASPEATTCIEHSDEVDLELVNDEPRLVEEMQEYQKQNPDLEEDITEEPFL
ncbi:MAG TPA: TraR/DksA C4-type zinc finger protein [Pseudogracilibacillus sp.]|nr:TraR/DksA C4-type zinc finger protein [Pseudogracilibacillus sp.]